MSMDIMIVYHQSVCKTATLVLVKYQVHIYYLVVFLNTQNMLKYANLGLNLVGVYESAVRER